MVLVDSCIWIEAAKAQGNIMAKLALEALLAEDKAAFCGPIKLEVMGALRKERREKFVQRMSVVPYLPMRDIYWDNAVQLSWRLRDKGITVPWNDVLISSIALRHNYLVYSVDSDFKLISNACGVGLYEPGYGGAYNPN